MSRVRISIIDSGVNPDHPHVGGIIAGVGFDTDGTRHDDFVDRLGHGTAVTAAIREKAPGADLLAAKVFDRKLAAPIAALLAAIDWSIGQRAQVINLSLGTPNQEHETALQTAVTEARAAGSLIVSALEHDGTRWLPGSLHGVVGVRLDWECPRDRYRVISTPEGGVGFGTSGYPRPIPQVPPEKNLKGISFAVANMSGFLARALMARPQLSSDQAIEQLAGQPSELQDSGV